MKYNGELIEQCIVTRSNNGIVIRASTYTERLVIVIDLDDYTKS